MLPTTLRRYAQHATLHMVSSGSLAHQIPARILLIALALCNVMHNKSPAEVYCCEPMELSRCNNLLFL